VESGVVGAEKLAPLRQEWSQREAVRHRRAARTGERLGERESTRRADRDFRYHLKASKNFLIETRSLPALTHSYPRRFTFYVAHPIRSILPSTFRLLSFLVRLRFRANDDTRDAVIARLAKAAWDSAQSLGQ
jgi:hypothetical protein